MAKLHELLAVDSNLKGQAEKTRAELVQLFERKRQHFSEKLVTFTPRGEGQSPVTDAQLDLQTTVKAELDAIKPFLSGAMDVSLQIAKANTEATADLVLENGQVLAAGLPATALLELEKRVSELRNVVVAIPTLDPTQGFRPDPDKGANIFRARDARTTRTAKMQQVLTLAPATEKHPAQVQLISVDVPVGEVLTQEWSGLITPAQKADMLARVDMLARAVKQARSRANETVVDTNSKIGDSLLGFVFGN